MEKHINRFLNIYLGDEVICKERGLSQYHPHNFQPTMHKEYHIYSGTGKLILTFIVRENNHFNLWRSSELCETISSWFCIDDEESMRYIKNWFAKKYDIKKIYDLIKFIPTPIIN